MNQNNEDIKNKSKGRERETSNEFNNSFSSFNGHSIGTNKKSKASLNSLQYTPKILAAGGKGGNYRISQLNESNNRPV